jgi:hypothetical protein
MPARLAFMPRLSSHDGLAPAMARRLIGRQVHHGAYCRGLGPALSAGSRRVAVYRRATGKVEHGRDQIWAVGIRS